MMRPIPVLLLFLLASLPLQPAAAEPNTKGPYASVAPVPSPFSLWRSRFFATPQQTESVARPSVSTSCLPSELKMALASVQARFGPVTVVSTHRPGSRIRGGPSWHASCRAVDFTPPAGTYAQVAAYLRRTWSGGIGTYSSGHIHIDTGPSLQWHSGGRRAARR